MATLGQRLREEREKRGLSIDDLAAQTRINSQYFLAIENDDVSGLPGGFFYRSFVRQYARLLDLPTVAYQAEIDRSLESDASISATQETVLPDRQINVPPIPTGRADVIVETRRWIIRLGALAMVIVVCSGVYTFWQRYQLQRAEAAKSVPHTPAPVAAPPQKAPAPVVPTPEPPTVEQAAVPAPVEPSPVTTPPAGGVQLIVRATELSWIGVWQGERLLFGDVIPAGESRGFGAPDRLRVRFGNAGGVDVKWNGQTIPATGPRGQVRTVDFRTDGYTVILPLPKPAADGSATPPQP
ncbi:MAG TPA: RodZ domain-containing protein [Paludibaculum sp.]|jgi:cytoskeletal protein RodZ